MPTVTGVRRAGRWLFVLCLPLVPLACTRATPVAAPRARALPSVPIVTIPEEDGPPDPYSDPLPPGALARIGTARLRHGDQVQSLAYSPDGKTLAAATGNGSVLRWDAKTRQPIPRGGLHQDQVWSVAFSPDGSLLAWCGGHDALLHLLDPKTRKERRALKGHRGDVTTLAFSPGGALLASADHEGTILLWNPRTGEKVQYLSGHNDPIRSLVFAPDGKRLASGSTDGTALLWDVERLRKK